ncbi:MAG: N-acetyltransferase family protein, partial [Actinomycetes bacterium]
MHLDLVSPADLDLDTADAIAELSRVSQAADGVDVTTPNGPARLKMYQHSSDNTPFAGIWIARDGERLLGYASAFLPYRENTDSVQLSGAVAVDARRRGIGRALVEAVLAHAAERGRTKAYSGAVAGGGSQAAMAALGFAHLHTYAINRLDLYDAPRERWQRLYDEAAARAEDYEPVRMVGRTPDDQVGEVVALFDAITDAPMTDPDAESDVWGPDRVRAYDDAMAARRQTVYRVMA